MGLQMHKKGKRNIQQLPWIFLASSSDPLAPLWPFGVSFPGLSESQCVSKCHSVTGW